MVLERRDFEFENQQCDDDGENAVAERLDRLSHNSPCLKRFKKLMISGPLHFGAKLAQQIPCNPSGQAKNDYVHAKLGCDGIISDENSDAEVDYGNRQPEPDENPCTIYDPLIFALVD
jgi:hypothetical protein